MDAASQIIDTDSHIIESADLWTSRLPSAWGSKVMHVGWNDERQMEVWYIGDRVVMPAWMLATYGWDGPFPTAPRTLDEAHPACYEPGARLKAMDEAGVGAAVLYPNIGGLGFDPFVEHPEPEISAAHVQAYNDYLIEEWSGFDPGRFIPLAVVPYWDMDRAVAEVARAASIGHRGIVMTGAPHQHGQPFLGDHHWDRLWAACQDADLPVSFHAANGDVSDALSPERMQVDGGPATCARVTTDMFLYNGLQMNDLLMSGILGRFPTLRFVSVESGLGWVPFLLESCDYHFKKSRVDLAKPEFGDFLPSDLFHRQVFVNYWFERLESWHVEQIGADNILFETDFPHPTCLAGHEVQEALQNGLAQQPDSVRERILFANAAKLYKL